METFATIAVFAPVIAAFIGSNVVSFKEFIERNDKGVK